MTLETEKKKNSKNKSTQTYDHKTRLRNSVPTTMDLAQTLSSNQLNNPKNRKKRNTQIKK